MEKVANKFIFVTTFITGTYIGLKSFTFTVDGGQRGLIFDRSAGLQPKIYGEGIHIKLPFLQSPIIQQIRLQAKSVALMALTKDQQTVDIAIRMLHAPIEEHLVEIQKTIGLNYEENILPSISSEVLSSVVAKYDTNQLISMNEKISQEVKDGLTVRAKEFKIILEDVSIIHLGFSKEYAQAIEQKFVAQQQAYKQMFIVEKDDQEKTAKVILSEGEAIAAQMINDAVKKYGGVQIEIRRLEATKIFAEMMANLLNIVNQKQNKK